MSGLGGLRLAVPRGALLSETLDLLDGLDVDTAEVRGNDRRLLFEDAGIVTMRPSSSSIRRRASSGRSKSAIRFGYSAASPSPTR